ncbi:hypothetical protein [Paracoccus sp. TOH]|uniref:hypothetical protein n=1 Tax=Paracoccus sp. TOH TaxID=1263728 RepID=UPI0025B20473|nr:hypothetical protein [Paracoccus sp. TOH]WJS86045.1 hypothetical protein NBE95_11590 [Paracoccus sp. TOH]
MALVWLIIAVTVTLTATIGALRAATRSLVPLALPLALLLGAAGLCYLISGTKTGGYLPGIVGALLCLLLLVAAGGLVLGAAGRWLYDRLSHAAAGSGPVALWDVWLLGGLGALAVLLSAME